MFLFKAYGQLLEYIFTDMTCIGFVISRSECRNIFKS